MKALFITTGGIEDAEFGGAKASIRNYMALKRFAEVEVYHIKKRSTMHSIQSLLQGIFPPVLREDVRKIGAILSEQTYDFVFMDCSHFGWIAEEVKKADVPLVMFFHNCESDYIQVRFGNKNTLQSRIYQRLIDKGERVSVKNADYKMVFTERDKERIESLYQTTIDAVIPIGLSDQYRESNKKGEYCLLFGPLGTANEEAFSWFVRNVSPYLHCKTMVAGKGFERYKEIWGNEKVLIKGFVKEVSEAYEGAACVAIPLFSGGGMKIKTAEALMFGKTIFGTEEAFVGYDFDVKQVGGLCQTAEAFIEKINCFFDRGERVFNPYSREQYLEKYSLEAADREFQKLERFLC